MKFQFALLLLAISMAGCVGPRKIDKWVNTEYSNSLPSVPKPNDFIQVRSPLFSDNNIVCKTEKKNTILPLIFYWHYDFRNTCALNPKIGIYNFTTSVNSYAKSKGLKQKLKDQTLELTVNKIPTHFALDDDGHVIVLLVIPVSWEYFGILPEKEDLVVSYKIMNGQEETKKGTITITNTDKALAPKLFQGGKRYIAAYLDQYSTNINVMSKQFVDKLINEL